MTRKFGGYRLKLLNLVSLNSLTAVKPTFTVAVILVKATEIFNKLQCYNLISLNISLSLTEMMIGSGFCGANTQSVLEIPICSMLVSTHLVQCH